MEILRDAFAEVAGFADVDDGAETVFHEIDAWLVGQLAQFISDVIGRGHRSRVNYDTGSNAKKGAEIQTRFRYHCPDQ